MLSNLILETEKWVPWLKVLDKARSFDATGLAVYRSMFVFEDGGDLVLYSFDTEVSCRIRTSISIPLDFERFVVGDVGKLRRFLETHSGQVMLSLEEGSCVVKSGRSRATIPRLDFEEDWIQEYSPESIISVPFLMFERGKRLGEFSSRDVSRPELSGVCIDGNRMFATDSFNCMGINSDQTNLVGKNIPPKLFDLISLLPRGEEVEIGLLKSDVLIFRCREVELSSVLISENPPLEIIYQLEGMFREYDQSFEVEKTDWKDALRRLGTFLNEDKVRIQIQDSVMTLSQNDKTDGSRIDEGINCKGGDGLDRCFRRSHLEEASEFSDGEKLIIYFGEEQKFVGVRKEDFYYWWMPIMA